MGGIRLRRADVHCPDMKKGVICRVSCGVTAILEGEVL